MANIHPSLCEEGIDIHEDIREYPRKTLEEDEDQGEMDTVFFILLAIYTLALSTMRFWYPDEKDYQAV